MGTQGVHMKGGPSLVGLLARRASTIDCILPWLLYSQPSTKSNFPRRILFHFISPRAESHIYTKNTKKSTFCTERGVSPLTVIYYGSLKQ